MSESLREPLNEPFFTCDTNVGCVELTAENTEVTYYREAAHALYNHIRVKLTKRRSWTGDMYIWGDRPLFKGLAELAIRASAPIHQNIREVPDYVRERYISYAVDEIDNLEGVPEEWSDKVAMDEIIISLETGVLAETDSFPEDWAK